MVYQVFTLKPHEIPIYVFLKGRDWIPTPTIYKFNGINQEATRRTLLRMEVKGLIKSKYINVKTNGGKQKARVWKIK